MSELVSVLSGRGNEPLAFKSISCLTGLMVKRSSSIVISAVLSRSWEAPPSVGRHVVRLNRPFLTFSKALLNVFSPSLVFWFSAVFCLLKQKHGDNNEPQRMMVICSFRAMDRLSQEDKSWWFCESSELYSRCRPQDKLPLWEQESTGIFLLFMHSFIYFAMFSIICPQPVRHLI